MSIKGPGQENVRYEVITQEDPDTGDLYIPIPQPILDRLGWKEGTNVDFGINANGQLYIKKAE